MIDPIENDSFLGKMAPPTPLMDSNAITAAYTAENIGMPVAPDGEQDDTDSRIAIIFCVREALGLLRNHQVTKTSSSIATWRHRGKKLVRYTLTNVTSAYSFVAREWVRGQFSAGKPVTANALVEAAPWDLVVPPTDAPPLPKHMLERLLEGLDFFKLPHTRSPIFHQMEGIEQQKDALCLYAEQIAWIEAGLDEIRVQEAAAAAAVAAAAVDKEAYKQ